MTPAAEAGARARLGNGKVLVSALVDYLDSHAPERIERLRRRNPAFAEALRPGRKLGAEDAEPVVFAELAKEALETARTRLDDSAEVLKRRMRRSGRVRLAGGAVAALSSVGLIGALVVEEPVAAIATAAVNLVSTIVTLLSQHFDSPVYGKGSGSRELFARLVGLISKTVEIQQALTLFERTGFAETEPLEMVRHANALIAELHAVEIMIEG